MVDKSPTCSLRQSTDGSPAHPSLVVQVLSKCVRRLRPTDQCCRERRTHLVFGAWLRYKLSNLQPANTLSRTCPGRSPAGTVGKIPTRSLPRTHSDVEKIVVHLGRENWLLNNCRTAVDRWKLASIRRMHAGAREIWLCTDRRSYVAGQQVICYDHTTAPIPALGVYVSRTKLAPK